MKIIIVGCGRIGSGLAQALDKAGHEVYVIDSNPAAFGNLNPAFKGKTVEGIGFDRDVLLKARIDRADAVAAVTSSDESNAVIAQLAREAYRVPKVVARMYDRQKADIYRRLGVLTLSSTTWGIRRAMDLINYSPLNTVTSLGSGEVDLVEIEVPALLIGRQARELMVSGEVIVTAIVRGNKTFIPTMGTTFEKDDLIYLAVATASTGRLKRLLGME
jgi:trk system potassium uptake protein TrkA